MTKTYGNFTDFIDFSRSSGGTALRRVSYGADLVDVLNDASEWTVYGTNTVENEDGAVKITYVDNASGAFEYLRANGGLGADLDPAKVYIFTAQVKATGGAVNLNFYDGATNTLIPIAADGDYVQVQKVFRAHVVNNVFINTNSFGSGEVVYFKDMKVKEVTFDQPSGDLVLFNHPDDIPRVEYDSNGVLKGLLIEEARTNLVTYSEDFSSSGGWSVIGVDRILNQAVAPDGSSSADFIYATSTGTDRRIYKAVSLTDGLTYTTSVYAKYAGKKYIRIYEPKLNQYAAFDLINGLVEAYTTDDAMIEDMGAGWYRCTVVDTAGPASNYHYIQVADAVDSNNTTTGTSYGVYIWGAQLEQGSFPTSYIPTSGATATRSADIASIATSNFGYNKNAGTVVVDFDNLKFTSGGTGFPRPFELGSSAHAGERINVYVAESSGNFAYGITTAIAAQAGGTFIPNTTSPIGPYKAGLAFKNDDVAAVETGGDLLTDTSAAITGGTYPRSTLQIGGSTVGTTNQINGHIKSIKYLPRRNTNTQLQEFTS